MTRERKYRFEVWLSGAEVRYFSTMEAAERYAHRWVADHVDERGRTTSVDLHVEFRHVATVSMDALNRVWTDVVATELI